ncbi:hypothetical protein [Streptomyces sp. NPDC016845]|uniref:hypothetical protein n=1 Tax=Streptomyces sp. NPDC016845 TaxID=3364972 RepID=UPI0037BCCAFA
MTPHFRPALLLTAVAALASAAAAYLATTSTPLWAALVAPFAVALGYCAACEWTRHRLVLEEHARARRAARAEVLAVTPCCRIYEHSHGQAHAATCPTRTRSRAS